MEVWKDIEHYEGYYQVSNTGKIRNERGQELAPFKSHNGYSVATLCRDGMRIKRYVHRLVALTFLDNPDNKPQVNHINHDKLDNRADNLEWCTAQENMKHMLNSRRSKQQCLTTLTCLITKKEHYFYSNAEASRFLGRYKDYVSYNLRNSITIVSDHAGNQYKVSV